MEQTQWKQATKVSSFGHGAGAIRRNREQKLRQTRTDTRSNQHGGQRQGKGNHREQDGRPHLQYWRAHALQGGAAALSAGAPTPPAPPAPPPLPSAGPRRDSALDPSPSHRHSRRIDRITPAAPGLRRSGSGISSSSSLRRRPARPPLRRPLRIDPLPSSLLDGLLLSLGVSLSSICFSVMRGRLLGAVAFAGVRAIRDTGGGGDGGGIQRDNCLGFRSRQVDEKLSYWKVCLWKEHMIVNVPN